MTIIVIKAKIRISVNQKNLRVIKLKEDRSKSKISQFLVKKLFKKGKKCQL